MNEHRIVPGGFLVEQRPSYILGSRYRKIAYLEVASIKYNGLRKKKIFSPLYRLEIIPSKISKTFLHHVRKGMQNVLTSLREVATLASAISVLFILSEGRRPPQDHRSA